MPARRAGGKPTDDGSVGSALRTAYQATVDEGVPDELLALLKKLN